MCLSFQEKTAFGSFAKEKTQQIDLFFSVSFELKLKFYHFDHAKFK